MKGMLLMVLGMAVVASGSPMEMRRDLETSSCYPHGVKCSKSWWGVGQDCSVKCCSGKSQWKWNRFGRVCVGDGPKPVPVPEPQIEETFAPSVSDEPCGNETHSPTPLITPEPTPAPTEPCDNETHVSPSPPTGSPTKSPTEWPTVSPTDSPTEPCDNHTHIPPNPPTGTPTNSPTELPTESPTNSPTESPTESPTNSPTKSPSKSPTISPTPCANHTESPTTDPPVGPKVSCNLGIYMAVDASHSIGKDEKDLQTLFAKNVLKSLYDDKEQGDSVFVSIKAFHKNLISLTQGFENMTTPTQFDEELEAKQKRKRFTKHVLVFNDVAKIKKQPPANAPFNVETGKGLNLVLITDGAPKVFKAGGFEKNQKSSIKAYQKMKQELPQVQVHCFSADNFTNPKIEKYFEQICDKFYSIPEEGGINSETIVAGVGALAGQSICETGSNTQV